MALSMIGQFRRIKEEAKNEERKQAERNNRRPSPVNQHVNNNVREWAFVMDGETTFISLDRDKMELTCNGRVVESTTRDFDSGGWAINFKVGDKSAMITSSDACRAGEGMTYTLTIDGNCVPGTRNDPDMDQRF